MEQRRITVWPPEILAWAEEEGLDLSGMDRGGNTWPPPASDVTSSDASKSQTDKEAAPLYLTDPTPNGRYAITKDIPLAHQKLEISAFARSAGDIKKVSLIVDGQEWYTWMRPPYRVMWPLAEGEHTFRVSGLTHDGSIINSAVRRITVLPTAEK